jgi:phospholipid/cholesterol/gamma-HCH transport system permease protein
VSVVEEGTRPAAAPARKVTAEEILGKTGVWEKLESAAGMGSLFVTSMKLALRPPFSWFRPAVLEASAMLRRCTVPLAVSIAVFMIGFGFFVLGGITVVLGASDREGGAVIIGFLREAAIWITGMIFAGVAGSAMAADLGSRKVRDELDALSVLGVDQIRALVVPKVIASIVVAPMLGMFAVLAVEAVNFGLGPQEFGFPAGVLYAATKGSLISLDVYGALIRYVIIGAFVAVIACYKGLTCKGGTEGVGRAVNQTIVLTFFGVWMLDAFFNLAYLSLFPAAQVDFKG